MHNLGRRALAVIAGVIIAIALGAAALVIVGLHQANEVFSTPTTSQRGHTAGATPAGQPAVNASKPHHHRIPGF